MIPAMTTLRWQLRLLIPFSFVLTACLITASSFAFHEQGVANCNGCHIMHESEDGMVVDVTNPRLLNDDTPSDVCLSCHTEQLGADPLAPAPQRGAGSFVFLLEDNLNDAPDGAAFAIPGSAAGHNLRAPASGLSIDQQYSMSPGGSFPASRMSCTACHDAHGNTNFRMLNGAGTVSGTQGFSFIYDAPEAAGISINGAPESNSNHTAYQSGMSQWCMNCHQNIHQEGATSSPFVHPTDAPLETEIINQYNIYNGTADPNGGNAATAYIAAVPFEDLANTTGSTAGPSGSSRINCLSCHRAHASSAPHSGRWDFNVSLLSQDGMVSGSYPIPSPYPDPTQGPLCEKCHAVGEVNFTPNTSIR